MLQLPEKLGKGTQEAQNQFLQCEHTTWQNIKFNNEKRKDWAVGVRAQGCQVDRAEDTFSLAWFLSAGLLEQGDHRRGATARLTLSLGTGQSQEQRGSKGRKGALPKAQATLWFDAAGTWGMLVNAARPTRHH